MVTCMILGMGLPSNAPEGDFQHGPTGSEHHNDQESDRNNQMSPLLQDGTDFRKLVLRQAIHLFFIGPKLHLEQNTGVVDDRHLYRYVYHLW